MRSGPLMSSGLAAALPVSRSESRGVPKLGRGVFAAATGPAPSWRHPPSADGPVENQLTGGFGSAAGSVP
jgi:hypothetical protein